MSFASVLSPILQLKDDYIRAGAFGIMLWLPFSLVE